MKLISLNVWGGAVNKPLLEFMAKRSGTDFFLLQEMHDSATAKTNWESRGNPNLFNDMCAVLSGHDGYFASAESGEFGLAGFVRRGVELTEHGDVFVHRHKDAMTGMDARDLGRNLQYFKVGGEHPYTLLNFHGLWTGQGKGDTPERLKQSERIVEFARSLEGEFVLAGDFNLLPETESISILEGLGVRNLIKDFGITDTRTSYYKKTPDRYADYTFVTSGIEVREFKILPDEVSDHAAMYLDFERRK